MIGRLSSYISQNRPEARPFVVGITGIDTSGKSELTQRLAQELERVGHPVQIIRLDDFHRPSAQRYRADLPEPAQYYEHSFDFDRLVSELLAPIRDDGRLGKSLICLDVVADTWTVERSYSVNRETVVLLEGVFFSSVKWPQ